MGGTRRGYCRLALRAKREREEVGGYRRMKVDLDGQTALVTGGAQGIGRTIVQVLADNGGTGGDRRY